MNRIYIDENAHVAENVVIGDSSKIWINSQIREGAVIGLNCVISKDTYIDTGVKIGDRVKIQNGVSIFKGVCISDDVFIGPNAVFTNDLVPRSFNKDWKITTTIVRKGASIGANATIICGNNIGEYALIGAGSVVTKDVPNYGLVAGNPARLIGYVCYCGCRLDGSGYCESCKKTINLIGGKE